MLKRVISGVVSTGFAAILLCGPSLLAQQSESPSGPIPAQIFSAQRAFISYGGQDSDPYPHGDWNYAGGPSRTYKQFHAAMKAWRRYELVDAPSKCDLVLQVRSSFITPSGPLVMRLEIFDPKTHVVLWGFTEYVRHSTVQSRRDKYFDEALARLVDDVKKFVAQSATTVTGSQN